MFLFICQGELHITVFLFSWLDATLHKEKMIMTTMLMMMSHVVIDAINSCIERLRLKIQVRYQARFKHKEIYYAVNELTLWITKKHNYVLLFICIFVCLIASSVDDNI